MVVNCHELLLFNHLKHCKKLNLVISVSSEVIHIFLDSITKCDLQTMFTANTQCHVANNYIHDIIQKQHNLGMNVANQALSVFLNTLSLTATHLHHTQACICYTTQYDLRMPESLTVAGSGGLVGKQWLLL